MTFEIVNEHVSEVLHKRGKNEVIHNSYSRTLTSSRKRIIRIIMREILLNLSSIEQGVFLV